MKTGVSISIAKSVAGGLALILAWALAAGAQAAPT